MKEKVILILSDGMRSDSLEACGNPYAAEFEAESTSCVYSRTVMPSITLPCHVSLFYGVDPSRHGTLSNDFAPMTEPIDGIMELLAKAGKKGGLIYNWEQLRDLARPGTTRFNLFYATDDEYKNYPGNHKITEEGLKLIKEEDPDFIFIYLGTVDSMGHRHGWMKEEYLDCVADTWDCIRQITEEAGADHQIIVTADHGGHMSWHGDDIDEDMNIPILMRGTAFEKGKKLEKASIMDIAPTIAELMGFAPSKDWEGHSLL